MALFIQLQHYGLQEEKTQKQKVISPANLENILLNLKKALSLGGTQTIRLEKEPRLNRAQLIFTAIVDKSSELLYRFWINQSGNIKSCISLFQKGNYLRARSNEIKKNIGKTITFINALPKKTQIFLTLDLNTAQFQLLHSNYLGCDQSKQMILANLKFLIGQCLIFAKSFASLLLYKSNVINKYSYMMGSGYQIQSYLTAQNGQFSNLSTIRQYLSLSSCKIQSSLKQIKQSKYQRNYIQNVNRIVEIYNNRVFPHDIMLFAEFNIFRKARKFRAESDEINNLMSSYNPKQPKPFDNNYVFSTIYIQQSDNLNTKEICIAQSAKAKLIYFRAKIKYGFTNHATETQNISSDDQFLSQSPTQQSYLGITNSTSIEKPLIVKIPRSELSPQLKFKAWKLIQHEKAVLRSLRGAKCMYIPKYYQTDQLNSRFRDMLIIDYVPGPTLVDFMFLKKSTVTLSWKLHLLMHLANALRFLDTYDIAHLDLSVNNIILTTQSIPKIIDFGQAYNQEVLLRSLKQKGTNTAKHLPGRTFPFAPPETTQRSWNFSSKQDIYSLGVIAFWLLMGYLPNICSERKMEQLYLNNSYSERIFLSPEGLEWTGEYEVTLTCMQLIMSCLHSNEHRRPNPSWAHILFKKLFEVVQTIS